MPATAALGAYTSASSQRRARPPAASKCRSTGEPEFEVIVTPASRFVVQGNEAVATVQARYYFGQPVANAHVRYVVNQQAYYSPLRWSDDVDDEEASESGTATTRRSKATLRLDAKAAARFASRWPTPRTAATTARGSRRRSPTRAAARSAATRVVHATVAAVPARRPSSTATSSGRRHGRTSARAVDYTGAPQADVPRDVRCSSASTIPRALLQPADGHADRARRTARPTARDASSTGDACPMPPGSYRVAVAAPERRAPARDDAWLWVPGRATVRPPSDDDRYLELLADKRTYAPGDTARLVVRGETSRARCWSPRKASTCPGTRCCGPRRPAPIEVPIADGDVGDIYVNIALPARRPALPRRAAAGRAGGRRARCRSPSRPIGRVAKPQEPGSLHRAGHRRRRPAGARTGEPGVIDEAVYGVKPDDTPDPGCASSTAASTAASAPRSRATTTSPASRARERLQLAAPAAAVHARRLQGRHGRRSRRCARSSPTRSTGWPISSPTPTGAATVTVNYPDALTTWRLTARAVTARHQGRRGAGAHDHDQGPDRAGHHAAVPDRRR